MASFSRTSDFPETSESARLGDRTGPRTGPRTGQCSAAGQSCKLQSKPAFAAVLPELWTLVKPLRWMLAVCLVLMLANRACGLAVPVAFRYLINDVMYQHRFDKLPLIISAVIVATCIQGVTTFLLSQKLSITGQRMIADLRKRVQLHVAHLPISFHDNNNSGAVAARIMNDVEGIRNFVGSGLLDLAGGILTAVIAVIILLQISPLMTALTLFLLSAFALFLKKAFSTTRPMFRERTILHTEVTGRLAESLGALRIVKGYRAEAGEARIFAGGVDRILNIFVASITAQSFLSLICTVSVGLVGGLVMYIGAMEVRSHHIDVGSYVEFLMLLAFTVAPIALLVSVGNQLTEALAGFERTVEILKERTEDDDPSRAVDIGPMQGSVSFRNVSFSYTPGKPVLHDICLKAHPGTVTALVGASGAGKSTIISLLCGFYSATSGEVLVDGIDLSQIRLSSYRQQLGVVLQDTFLFDGSIRENVVFSRPQATREQWLEACRIARVDEFAERFPEQYETVVGERGVKLSGGQRQRISIARAILADPRILILDEATSSLDSESEALIQAGLTSLMRGRTTFVIAHRLSTIRRADQILVLDRGRIVERGTHASLHALRGHYYDFYNRQHSLETNLFLAPGEGALCPERV